jgi:hypothetical protein
VEDESGEEADASNPDRGAVTKVMQPDPVFVDRVLPGKYQEVSCEVTREEEEKGDPGEGDEKLFADRRVPERSNRTGEGFHAAAEAIRGQT